MNHIIKSKGYDINIVKIPINTIVKPSQETSTVCLSEVSQSLSHYRDRGKFY